MNWKEDCYWGYLNLEERTDRLEHVKGELKKIGVEGERTVGKKPNEIADWDKNPKYRMMYRRTPGAIGCFLGQLEIMEKAFREGKHAIVLEDDVVFCSDLWSRMEILGDFLDKMNDWDVAFLGGTVHKEPTWHKILNGQHTNMEIRGKCNCNLNRDWDKTHVKEIIRVYGAFSTYAYVVNYLKIPKIMNLLNSTMNESIGIDWSFIKHSPNLKCFMFIPGMVKQIDNQSNIGKGQTIFSKFSSLGEHWYMDKNELNYEKWYS